MSQFQPAANTSTGSDGGDRSGSGSGFRVRAAGSAVSGMLIVAVLLVLGMEEIPDSREGISGGKSQIAEEMAVRFALQTQ